MRVGGEDEADAARPQERPEGGRRGCVDLLVDNCLVVEAKAVDATKEDTSKFRAQTLSYLKLLDLPLGLVVNFHNPRLGDRGIARVILKGAGVP